MRSGASRPRGGRSLTPPRSHATLNRSSRLYDTLQPEDLQAAARKYFSDARLVVATLAHEALPAAIALSPPLDALRPAAPAAAFKRVQVASALPQLRLKLLFQAGPAPHPAGRGGLAGRAAA